MKEVVAEANFIYKKKEPDYSNSEDRKSVSQTKINIVAASQLVCQETNVTVTHKCANRLFSAAGPQ